MVEYFIQLHLSSDLVDDDFLCNILMLNGLQQEHDADYEKELYNSLQNSIVRYFRTEVPNTKTDDTIYI